MTRGKYAARAAERTAQLTVAHDLGTYQRKVRDQHEEIQQLKARIADLERRYRDDTRRLRVERDEGVAPTLIALQGERDKYRADAVYWRARQEHVHKEALAALGRMHGFLVASGMRWLDARDICGALFQVADDSGRTMEPGDVMASRGEVGRPKVLNPDDSEATALIAVARSKGYRR